MALKVSNVLPERRLWPQCLGSIGAYLTMFEIGLMVGWSSPYIAKLQAADSPLLITADEASWVASLVNLGRLPGAILSAVGMDYLGGRKTLLLTNVPTAIAWICLIFADSVPWLYAARFLSGIAFSLFLGSFPLYMGEISDPRIRGALVSFATGGLSSGNLIGSLMGAYLSIMNFAIIALVPNIIVVILIFFLPDTPHYFMKEGNIEETEKSIRWYDHKADVKTEMAKIEQFVNATPPLSLMQRFEQLMLPHNRRAVIITFFLQALVQLSGLVSIAFYLEVILTNAKVTVLAPSMVVVAVTATGIVSGWVSIYLIEKCGRKSLLAAAFIGVSISMFMLGLDYKLIGMNYNATELQWLAITAVVIFRVFVCIGMIPIPSTILSELFPSNIKSIATSIANLTAAASGFFATVTYQPFVNLMTESNTFFMYAVVMAIGAIYAITIIPETKGKSLQEIQDMLTNKYKKNSSKIHG